MGWGALLFMGALPPAYRLRRYTRALRSSVYGDLMIPFARSAAMQNRSFAVVGPTTWNGLSLTIRSLPAGGNTQFHQLLKTNFYRLAWVGSASE